MNYVYASDEEFEAHSSVADSYNETTVYHEATPEISHYETVTTPAYDEQILVIPAYDEKFTYHACSCGASTLPAEWLPAV